MDRDIPAFNRPIMQRIQAKNHELHLKRLKNIKSSISSTKPYQRPTYANISNPVIDPYKRKYPNLKKDMIEETKNAEIQRENALLFKKMVRIMKRPDRNNDPMNRTSVTMNAGKNRLSMEFSRINEQNRALFHRLEQQRPTIDVRKLQEERVKNLNILRFLGKYPNQQAESYSNNTEQSRQKKTLSSTRNGQYYRNNYRNNSYEGEQQQYQEEERFRQGIEGYDREVNRIRNQMGNVRTMNQFYNLGNINKGQIIGNSNGNRHNRTMNPLYPQDSTAINPSHQATYQQLEQPTIPDRKKFLSQGSTRRTMYQNKFISNPLDNLNDDNKVGFLNNSQKDAQPYPYYLNHPSHNLALQEMNRHSIEMQSNTMEYVAKEIKPHTAQVRRNYKDSSNKGRDNVNDNNLNQLINPTIANTHNSMSKNIPQRKLNTKNSSTNISTKVNNNTQLKPQSQQSPAQQQPQPNPNLAYNHNPHNIPSHPISTNNRTNLIKLPNPAIRTNQVPEGRQVHATKQLNYNNQQVINSKVLTHNIYGNVNSVVNSTMPNILLYKAAISLDTVIVQEELQELCQDICQDLVTQHPRLQSLRQQIVANLKRISKQLSMSRTPESYLISLKDTSNRTNPTSKDNINPNITDTPSPKPSVLQLLRQKFLKILPLEIPQQQGSLLLQQVDYDYKYFITQMLRVQKDTEEDDMGDKAAVYRLVVGWTDSQPHSVHANNMENAEHPQNTRDRLYDNGSCNQNQNKAVDRQQGDKTLKEQDGSMQHQEAGDMGQQNQGQSIREGSYDGIDGIAGYRANSKLVLDQPQQSQQQNPTPQNNPAINQQQHNTSQNPLTNHYQQALEEQIA